MFACVRLNVRKSTITNFYLIQRERERVTQGPCFCIRMNDRPRRCFRQRAGSAEQKKFGRSCFFRLSVNSVLNRISPITFVTWQNGFAEEKAFLSLMSLLPQTWITKKKYLRMTFFSSFYSVQYPHPHRHK